MTLGPNTLKKSVTADKSDIKWLDYQIDRKGRWASYSHFFRYAIRHFRVVEPRRKKKKV